MVEDREEDMPEGDNADRSGTKRMCITLSKALYVNISKEAQVIGKTASSLVVEIVRKWYYGKLWDETDNALNLEMRIDKIVRSRVSEPINEMLMLVKRLEGELEELSNGCFTRSYAGGREEAPMDEEIDELSKVGEMHTEAGEDYPDVSGDLTLSDILNNVSGDEENASATMEVNQYMENRYGGGKFGEVKGDENLPDDVKNAFGSEGAESSIISNEDDEERIRRAEEGAKQEQESQQETHGTQHGVEEEKKDKQKLRTSKIDMSGDIPKVEGLTITAKVGKMVIYSDNSIWDRTKKKWYKRGKELIQILKEEEF